MIIVVNVYKNFAFVFNVYWTQLGRHTARVQCTVAANALLMTNVFIIVQQEPYSCMLATTATALAKITKLKLVFERTRDGESERERDSVK